MKKLISVVMSIILMFSVSACAKVTEKDQITTSSTDENSDFGMINPIKEYDTIDKAQKATGFTFKVITAIPDGFSQDKIWVIDDKIAQVVYKSGDDEILYRMAKGTEDISGDYTVYENEKECDTDMGKTLLKGTKDGYMLATFTDDTYTYSIMLDKAKSESDFVALVSSVK